MFFSLEVLPAHKGDCLLLHYGSDEPRLVMIDGGPSDVYQPHLKPRLDQIRKQRGLAEGKALPVDVLMVSHVDDDHIKGILDLTRELNDRKRDGKPLPYRVRSLWHNSFDAILKTVPEQLKGPAQFGAAALGGDECLDGLELDVAKVLASVAQGHQLRSDAKFLGWKVNGEFGEELVMATSERKVVTLNKTLKFTVLGPMQHELKALQAKHDAWLRTKKEKGEEAAAPLAAYLDESVPNLSSLVLLAEVGEKRILLTGDARGDKILKGLELAGLVEDGGPLHVDVLKVPHHGSDRNVEEDFFHRITADHYVFSGDGEHGNPERETLEMILEARGDDPFVAHFTYALDEIDEGRKADWKKEQAKKAKKGLDTSAWSASRQSLAALFEERDLPNERQKLEFPGEEPHLIELLDPVTFGD
jgi:hypothetical protein